MTEVFRPRRTMLYVPGHTLRHIEKARHLPADSIIFDLQESVPPKLKDEARSILAGAFDNADFGCSEKVVRINPLESPWGEADVEMAVALDIDAIMVPRMESATQLCETLSRIDRAGGTHLDIMVNIESPLGVLKAEEIAGASDRLTAMVMGTTDLANELKLNPTPDRTGLVTSLALVLLAGRAHKRCVIDGPHFNLKDVEACEFSCRQARDLGFDGKTVIHPVQLDYTNDAFTPKQIDIRRAQRIITAIEQAQEEGRSMAVVDDRLIEPVMEEWARRIISLYETVHELGQSELLGPVTR